MLKLLLLLLNHMLVRTAAEGDERKADILFFFVFVYT